MHDPLNHAILHVALQELSLFILRFPDVLDSLWQQKVLRNDIPSKIKKKGLPDDLRILFFTLFGCLKLLLQHNSHA